jgi:hypothetical protein
VRGQRRGFGATRLGPPAFRVDARAAEPWRLVSPAVRAGLRADGQDVVPVCSFAELALSVRTRGPHDYVLSVGTLAVGDGGRRHRWGRRTRHRSADLCGWSVCSDVELVKCRDAGLDALACAWPAGLLGVGIAWGRGANMAGTLGAGPDDARSVAPCAQRPEVRVGTMRRPATRVRVGRRTCDRIGPVWAWMRTYPGAAGTPTMGL